jgi:hypothetical protein
MELDRAYLKEMGVAKLGDQIRIAAQAKNFRTREYKKPSKRVSNRVCDNGHFRYATGLTLVTGIPRYA